MPFHNLPVDPSRSHSDSRRHSVKLTMRPVHVSGLPVTDRPCRIGLPSVRKEAGALGGAVMDIPFTDKTDFSDKTSLSNGVGAFPLVKSVKSVLSVVAGGRCAASSQRVIAHRPAPGSRCKVGQAARLGPLQLQG